MYIFFQTLVNGLLIGGIYSLAAIGLTLIWGVMGIVNFAHGSFLMLGAYLTYWLWELWSFDPLLSLLICLPLFFILGMLFYVGTIARILDAPHHIQILLTIGIFIFLDNMALFFWSPDPRSVTVDYLMTKIHLGNVLISIPRLIAFIVACVLTMLLYLVLKKTTIGKAVRAAANDKLGAYSVGINVEWINRITFGIGVACAAGAGTLISLYHYVTPHMGFSFAVMSFVIVVLGGMGNFWGALCGGLIIGITQSFGAILISGSARSILSFVVFILILLFKPEGLFGIKLRE